MVGTTTTVAAAVGNTVPLTEISGRLTPPRVVIEGSGYGYAVVVFKLETVPSRVVILGSGYGCVVITAALQTVAASARA